MREAPRSLPLLAAAVILGACAPSARAQPAAPDQLVRARPAPLYDLTARCPGLRAALVEEQPTAVVVFRVGVTGVPSQASIRSSSRSADLDAAAVRCVQKLRFLPATRLGEGTAFESWQEVALQRVRPSEHLASPAIGSFAAPADAARPTDPSRPAPRGAVVRACVDASGALADGPTLVRSSGDSDFDQAALRVARSGAGAYRSAAAGGAVASCLRLTISPDSE